MSARKIILGFAVCLSLGTLAQQVLSQSTGSGGLSGGTGPMRPRSARPPGMPGRPDFERMQNMSPEEKMKYYQQFLEEQRKAMEQQESLAMQRALGASDEQWKVIEPILKKVRHYREQTFIGTKPPFQSSFSSFSAGPGGAQGFSGGFGSSFQFQGGTGGNFQTFPGRQDSDGPISDGEILCEEIQMLLDDPQATPEQVSQKLDALRIARDKARRQWIAAQQQLKDVLDFRQQARLVLMGLLD